MRQRWLRMPMHNVEGKCYRCSAEGMYADVVRNVKLMAVVKLLV